MTLNPAPAPRFPLHSPTSQRLHSPSSLTMGILVITQQPGKPTWTLLARCLGNNTGEGVCVPTPLRAVLGASLYFCIPANPHLSLSFQVKFISRSPDNSPCFSRWVLVPPLEMHAVCQGWTGTFSYISTKKFMTLLLYVTRKIETAEL